MAAIAAPALPHIDRAAHTLAPVRHLRVVTPPTTITLVSGPKVALSVAAIADMDRRASNSSDSEQAWRLWAEHAIVIAALAEETPTGALCAFPTGTPHLWVLHKIVLHPEHEYAAIEQRLMGEYIQHLDALSAGSLLTITPEQVALHRLAVDHGFRDGGTEQERLTLVRSRSRS